MTSVIQKVRSALKNKGLDAFLVTKEVNVSYVTGLPIADSYLFLCKNKNIILTDFRYALEAKKLKNFTFRRIDASFSGILRDLVADLKLKKIGFEGGALPYNAYLTMKKALKNITLVGDKGFIEEIRAVKEKHELQMLREAIRISRLTFRYVKNILKTGISERELAKKIDICIRNHGGDDTAFPTIVASGPNAAQPHAVATNRKLRRHEPIVVDLGVRVNGYNSDLTRTFYLGKISPKYYRIYNVIYGAQKHAIARVKPGRAISEIDEAARKIINEAGFGKYFGHALGHGIGREIHEYPKISKAVKSKLTPGMVFTIEPGVYIPGWGGIRIEDMVLVTKNSCKVLTDDIGKTIQKR